VSDTALTTHTGETVTVILQGDADLAVVDLLLASFAEARAVPGVRRIVVNLAGVPFMDSSGLGALIAGFRFARQDGLTFEVVHPTSPVRSLLAITGVANLFADDDNAKDGEWDF
jgi:anti-sigma B factor antagonist